MSSVLVVGGAAGIGRAVVEGCRASGDDVVLVDAEAEAGVVAAGPAAGRGRWLRRDPGDPAMPAEAVATAVAEHGGLDGVVVTAATMRSAPLAEWTRPMWDATLALNLAMPFFVTQAAAPHLARSTNPAIVFLSSTAALRGNAGAAAYQASKAALPAVARSVTAELGPLGIRVNCVLPGWIDTPLNDAFWSSQPHSATARAAMESQIPLRRHGRPIDVAELILFLLSPAARYVAGTSLVVDGGYTAV